MNKPVNFDKEEMKEFKEDFKYYFEFKDNLETYLVNQNYSLKLR